MSPRFVGAGLMLAVFASPGCTTAFDRSRIPRAAGESCVGLEDCTPGLSCCAVTAIPGGTFDRGWDASDMALQDGEAIRGWQSRGAAPATVSAFRMDVFEVTVGRMRAFAAAYEGFRAGGRPLDGEGAVAGSPRSGFRAELDAWLPTDRAALEAQLRCDAVSTWDGDPNLPINCVSYPLALAFCLWDGGRLPTEAEWAYAASGGDEQRAFPWSEPPSDLAVSVGDAVLGGLGRPSVVGSAPVDTGRWLQQDLGGNVREWVLDTGASLDVYVASCVDCADTRPSTEHIRRGGDYDTLFSRARTAYRGSEETGAQVPYDGFRCVRP